MQHVFDAALGRITGFLGWMPGWLAGVIVLVLVLLGALLVHRVATRLVYRFATSRREFLVPFVARSAGPTRAALVLFAIGAALPALPFSAVALDRMEHVLLVGFILLLGWVALLAVRLMAELYLRRFRTDTEDNLLARKHVTQVRILQRAVDTLIVLITVASALMTFSSVRQYGVSLFASAGAAGLVVGLAARPLLSNLIAGVQIAMTQPIRLEDAVIVEGEFGWIEEIASTYVVVRCWDWRRLIVPLSYFIEKPFQNWTREKAALLGSVYLYVDYSVPVEAVRKRLAEIASESALWDGQVVGLQVSDAKDSVVELRALVSARNAGQAWDLRCEVREKLIAFLQAEYPGALPRVRAELDRDEVRMRRAA
jgi:small-conductance mechanosensitive channel